MKIGKKQRNKILKNKALLLLIFCLIGCKKETPILSPIQANKFMATVYLNPTEKTLYYDVFVSNDKVYWLTIKTIKKSEVSSNPFSFGFTFEDFWCNGVIAVSPNKKLFGAIRETMVNNEIGMLPDNVIQIK